MASGISSPELGVELVNQSSAKEPECKSYIGSSSGGGEINIVPSPTQPEDEYDDPLYTSTMDSMRERVENFPDTLNQWSIFRVPSWLRELSEDAYTPRLVSIGPIHSDQKNLKAMEAYKTWYMESLFKRSRNHDKTFSDCVRAILSVKDIAVWYYHDYQALFPNDKRLAEILLVDGCFILELLIRRQSPAYSKVISGDPMFAAGMMM